MFLRYFFLLHLAIHLQHLVRYLYNIFLFIFVTRLYTNLNVFLVSLIKIGWLYRSAFSSSFSLMIHQHLTTSHMGGGGGSHQGSCFQSTNQHSAYWIFWYYNRVHTYSCCPISQYINYFAYDLKVKEEWSVAKRGVVNCLCITKEKKRYNNLCKWKVTTGIFFNSNYLSWRKVSFLTGPHCQYLRSGQSLNKPNYICGMRSTKSPNFKLEIT